MGLLLVYAKPLPNNDDQAGGGYLIQQQQQQQQQPYSAGKEFVVSYGGDDIIIATNYNLDNSPADELNTDSSPSSSSPAFSENPPNVTPTIQENPTLTTEKEGGGLVAWEWFDNFVNGLDNIGKQFGDNPQLTPQSPEVTPTVKDKFLNFPCGGSRSVCCSGQMNNPGIAGKHTCANSMSQTTCPTNFFFLPHLFYHFFFFC